METEDLDDILDSALDELDDGDDEGEGDSKVVGENESSAREGLGGAGEPPSARAAGAAAQAQVGIAKEGEGGAGSGKTKEGVPDAELNLDEKELQETIAKTIEMLGRTNLEAGQGGGEDGAMFDEAFLSELATEFERLGSEMREGGTGGGQNEDRIVDDMVKHLLCKDLMYPPLKQVTDAYPAWLARPESKQKQEEYERYKEQYELFQQIVRVYETDENNMGLLLDLMTKAQEFGQPPKEMLEELMPGGLAGASGLLPPGLGGPDGEACCIM